MGKFHIVVVLALAAMSTSKAQTESVSGQVSSSTRTTSPLADHSPSPTPTPAAGGVISNAPLTSREMTSSTLRTTPDAGSASSTGQLGGGSTADALVQASSAGVTNPAASADRTSAAVSGDGTRSVASAGLTSAGVASAGLMSSASSRDSGAVPADTPSPVAQTMAESPRATSDQFLRTSSSADGQFSPSSSSAYSTPAGPRAGTEQSLSVSSINTVSSSYSGLQMTSTGGQEVEAGLSVSSTTTAGETTVNASPSTDIVSSSSSVIPVMVSEEDVGSSGVQMMTSSITLSSTGAGHGSTVPDTDSLRSSLPVTSSASRMLPPEMSTESQPLSSSQAESIPLEILPSELPASIQSSSPVDFSTNVSISLEHTFTVTADALFTDTRQVSASSSARSMGSTESVASSLSSTQSPPPSRVTDGMLVTSSMQVGVSPSLSSAGTTIPTPDLSVSLSPTSVIATMPSTFPPSPPETASTSATSTAVIVIHPTATSTFTTWSATSPSSTNATVPTTTLSATTLSSNATTTPSKGPSTKTVRYMFVLSGDCHLVLNNSEYFGRFLAAFHDLLTKQLHIKDDTYKLGEVTCGSVRVYVTFMNVIMPEFDVMIQTAIHNGGRALSVPVWIDSGQFMTFEVTHAEQVELKPDVDTYNIVSTVMDEVDIIVIVVACCVCGVLIAIGIAICVKECYRRKYAQSFDLLEIPHVNLKLEDFTLTRIPRPKTIYTEGSSVTMKSFTDGGGGGGGRSHQQNGGSLSHSSNGHTRTPSINAEDMHVRVKSHSEGIVIGITSSQPHSAAGATGDPFSNGTLKKNKSRMRTPSGDDYPEGEYQASERLLGGRPHDVDGTLNPVFVDEVEGEEGEGGLDEGAVL